MENFSSFVINFFYICMPLSVFIAITQLFLEYKWRKRNSAQEAIWRLHNLTEITLELNSIFGITTRHKPIPLSVLNKKIEQDSNIRIKIQQLLNAYDAISRGINQGIYNEEIIKIARGQCLIRQYTNYLFFIIDRRKLNLENSGGEVIVSYSQLEKVAIKWNPSLKQLIDTCENQYFESKNSDSNT